MFELLRRNAISKYPIDSQIIISKIATVSICVCIYIYHIICIPINQTGIILNQSAGQLLYMNILGLQIRIYFYSSFLMNEWIQSIPKLLAECEYHFIKSKRPFVEDQKNDIGSLLWKSSHQLAVPIF